MKWNCTPEHEAKFQELKNKLANLSEIGVPTPQGEIVLIITDGSDLGGGCTIFQWQSLQKEKIPEKFQTIGVKNDGKLKHTYPENCRLVCLRH